MPKGKRKARSSEGAAADAAPAAAHAAHAAHPADFGALFGLADVAAGLPHADADSAASPAKKARRAAAADDSAASAAAAGPASAAAAPAREFGFRSGAKSAAALTHSSRPANMRAIFTESKTPEDVGMQLLHHAAVDHERAIGTAYTGPVDLVGGAPPKSSSGPDQPTYFTLPVRATVEDRKKHPQAALFGRMTDGDYTSANRYAQDEHGIDDERARQLLHLKPMGSHGKDADRKDNLVVGTKAANGVMIPVDAHLAPGMQTATWSENQAGTHLSHVIHQGWTHPAAPNILFGHQEVHAQRAVLYPHEYDMAGERGAAAAALFHSVDAEQMAAVDAMSGLHPAAWPERISTIRATSEHNRAELATAQEAHAAFREANPEWAARHAAFLAGGAYADRSDPDSGSAGDASDSDSGSAHEDEEMDG